MTAIAIVGMGCRFAGARDPSELWALLRAGRDAFGPVPADRWDHRAFLSDSARDMDRTTSPAGAFLDDVRHFPALALGIPPRRVEVMDPQQRMTLVTSLEAIEDAGLTPERLPRATGVYVGITAHEYRFMQAARTSAVLMAAGELGTPPDDLDALAAAVERVVPVRPFSAPGVLGNMAAAAVAQELDLHGPAFTTDAACASALVALDDAVSALRSGRIDAALAGGAYLQLSPEHYVAFTRIGAMSPSGRCRPFDASADGFVQGDGVAMLLLKRLDDALADGDRVYAVIHGVAVNNDGRGDGPMAPVQSGQEDVIRLAWRDAGLDPARASHVETHGTGTAVGDVCEVHGLKSVFAGAPRVALGSAKANIGHTMSAAGIAGVVKAVLSLHYGELPPLAGFEVPKDALALGDGPLWIPTAPTSWSGPDRLAGVSSFGFGGTNGHAVLGAPPPVVADARTTPELVLLSAPSQAALRTLAGRVAAAVRADAQATVAGVARSFARRRRQPWRAGLVAASVAELLAGLDALASGAELPVGVNLGEAPDTPARVAFLFPGQGSQRLGMMRDIAARFPVVRDTLAELESALADELPVPLTHLLWPELRETPLSEEQAFAELTATEHAQPVLLAAGVALARLLAEVGVRPQVTLGHSLGEFTAMVASGLSNAADAARFVARRGRAMQAWTAGGRDPGAMIAIQDTAEIAAQLLVPGAVVANHNHPRQHVISGTTAAIDAVAGRAEAAGVKATRLAVSHGFHGPALDGLDVAALVAAWPLQDAPAAGAPVASAIVPGLLTSADAARAMASAHATSPVRFTDALRSAADLGADVFLQVGAGGPLASFARGTPLDGVRAVLTLASLEDAGGDRSLLDGLAALWLAGVDLDPTALCAPAPAVVLPPSILPVESYWAVKDTVTRPLKLGDGPARPRPEPRPEPTVSAPEPTPEATAPDSAEEAAREGVLAVVAKVSAYPKASLKLSMRLTEDLGFDSLMVGDLATRLAEAFPGTGGLPQELLINGPTVGDLVDFVLHGTPGADAADDDAPLSAWTPAWASAPHPEPPPAFVGRVGVVGRDGVDLAPAARALTAAGLDAVALSLGDARTADVAALVWLGPDEAPEPVAHVADGHVSWPDTAADLLEVLAARRAPVHVIAVSRDDDPWAGAKAGALRALAQEWPGHVLKHVTATRVAEGLAAVPSELTSVDRTAPCPRCIPWRSMRRPPTCRTGRSSSPAARAASASPQACGSPRSAPPSCWWADAHRRAPTPTPSPPSRACAWRAPTSPIARRSPTRSRARSMRSGRSPTCCTPRACWPTGRWLRCPQRPAAPRARSRSWAGCTRRTSRAPPCGAPSRWDPGPDASATATRPTTRPPTRPCLRSRAASPARPPSPRRARGSAPPWRTRCLPRSSPRCGPMAWTSWAASPASTPCSGCWPAPSAAPSCSAATAFPTPPAASCARARSRQRPTPSSPITPSRAPRSCRSRAQPICSRGPRSAVRPSPCAT